MNQLMYSFAGLTPPAEILDGVRRGEIGAFCLFAHQNVASPAQVRDLTERLYRAAAEGGQPRPLIGIDQEGGQLVAITGGATELPGNMALGATRSPELAEQAGRVLGRELLAMGVNLNFAPSLDVETNSANPTVGIRSFGDDPALVAELGAALIRGTQAEGALATAKHFPGHGDTRDDSHYTMPTVAGSLQRLREVELLPFRAAIAAGVGVIMSAHAVYTALDGANPATLSPRILDGLLRREMGFEGLILTDAMDMYAVAQFGRQESVRAALAAGADLVLLGNLLNQSEFEPHTRDLIRPDALKRIRSAREKTPATLPDLSLVGCAEHQAIAQQIADRSITLVRDGGRLPLRLGPDDTLAVITVRPLDLTPADTSSTVTVGLADALRRRHQRVQALELPYRPAEADIRAVLQASEQAKAVVVGAIRADQEAGQAEVVKALHGRGQRPIVAALRTPYDVVAFPMIETYLCAYGIRAATTEAIARVLFGEIEARGVLPSAIPGIAPLAGREPPSPG